MPLLVGKGQASPKSSLSQSRAKAMHEKLEMMRAQTDQAMENADKSRERQLHANEQLMKTILSLQEFEAEAATQKEVLEILFEGIRQFSSLKTQWSRLLLFFTDIATQIKFGMGKPMINFVKHSEIIKADKEAGLAITKADIDQVYLPCYEAVKVRSLKIKRLRLINIFTFRLAILSTTFHQSTLRSPPATSCHRFPASRRI